MAITRLNNNSITSITALPSAVAVANTPSFLVRNGGSGQSIANGTTVKITAWDTADFDTDSGWDATNSKFVIPTGKGGKYLFSASLKSGSTSDLRLHTRIYLNGSWVTGNSANITYYASTNTIVILDCSAGDYIEVYGKSDESSGTTVGTDSREEYFLGYKLI